MAARRFETATVQIGLLATAMVLAMTTWFAAAAVLADLREKFDLSRTGGSWLTIAVQLGFVVGALGSAFVGLADRVAPRRLVLIGSLVAAAANLTLLVAPTYASALGGRALTGAGLALVYPPALKAAATWLRARRGLGLGIMVGALTLGSAAPHLVSAGGGPEWRTTIIATSAVTVIGGLLAGFVGRDGPYPFSPGRFDPRRTLDIVRQRDLRLATLGYFGHMWELYAMWTWFGAFYRDVLADHGHDDAAELASLATFAVIGVGAAGCVVAGVMSDRVGRASAAAGAMAVSGSVAMFIGFLVDANPRVVLAIGLVWGFAVVADSAQFSTIISERARPDAVGTALTTQLATGFVLTVFTIFLVPAIESAHGWGWAFAVLAPGPALGVAAMVALSRPQPADPVRGGGLTAR